jgi:DNA polymerase
MHISDLNPAYDQLQAQYGARELTPIYNGGCEDHPDICFVFMNPTGRNIASARTWTGRKSPWLGTKNIWKLFAEIGLFDRELLAAIQAKKPADWDYDFCDRAYQEIADHKVFITNLGKCTQIDARPLPDKVFRQYLKLLHQEISIVQPKIIIAFGNQVSSLLLDTPINVSKCRKQSYQKQIAGKAYDIYPVYYPVGNGMRNISLVIEDLKHILKNL